jgi:hypothetical protein
MADAKISDLPAATTPLAGTELVPIVQGAETRRVAASAFDTHGLSGYCSGKPTASEVVAGGVSPYAFSIVQANCFAKALIAATGSTTFIIRRGGTQIGTVVFAAAATLGTVTITSAAVAIGDYVTIEGPATADATLANISFLLVE